MVYHIGLNNSGLHFQIQAFRQQLGKRAGNSVVSEILQSMNWDKGRPLTRTNGAYCLKRRIRRQLRRQTLCRRHIPGLGSLVFSVALYRALRRCKDDGRKVVPREPVYRCKGDDGRTWGPLSQDTLVP